MERLFVDSPEEAAWRERVELCPGLAILPSSPALAGLERNAGPGRARSLAAGLTALGACCDEVLIDCPPALGLPIISALAACDRLLVPVQTEFLALEGLERMAATIKMVERSLARRLAWHVVPTLYDARTGAARRSLAHLRDRYPNAWPGLVPVDTSLRDAAEAGQLYPGAPARAGQAYLALLNWLDGSPADVARTAEEIAA